MTNKIANYRNAAAQRQKWLCHYCNLPMGGEGTPYTTYIPLKKKYLLVTAEHLHARQDGGADTEDNIVAAHAICNRRRHKSGLSKSPTTLANHVKSRLAKNRWFSSGDLKLLTEAREAKLVHGTKFPRTTGQHSSTARRATSLPHVVGRDWEPVAPEPLKISP